MANIINSRLYPALYLGRLNLYVSRSPLFLQESVILVDYLWASGEGARSGFLQGYIHTCMIYIYIGIVDLLESFSCHLEKRAGLYTCQHTKGYILYYVGMYLWNIYCKIGEIYISIRPLDPRGALWALFSSFCILISHGFHPLQKNFPIWKISCTPNTMPVQQIQAFLLCGTLFLLSFVSPHCSWPPT
jgi:hypothetical protein